MFRLKKWVELAREVTALRLFIDGSFVTSKHEPNDMESIWEHMGTHTKLNRLLI